MSEHEFDAVIVGAGHNSLVLGNYLARCGLSVVLLERKLEAGGGLISEELTVPGYWNNTASYLFDECSIQPVHRDLRLDQYFVRYVLPEVQASLLLRGGGTVSLCSDVEASARSIARFSQRDANTLRDTLSSFESAGREQLLSRLRGVPRDGLAAPKDGWLYDLARQSPRQVVESLFESEPLRALVLTLLATQRGVLPDYDGMGWTVPFLLDQARRNQIVAGGSHVLAQALLRALVREGGRYHVLKQVARITVEGGAATGVELADGTRYRARRLVASGVDVWQTVSQLMPDETVGTELRQAVREFRPDEFALFQVHLSLTDPPRYPRAEEADRALQVVIGPESAEEVARLWQDVRAERLPDQPAMVCSTPTAFDSRQAPRDRHAAFLTQVAPYEFEGRPAQAWSQARDWYMERCLGWWRQHAPGLDGATIEWRAPLTPWEQARRLTSMVRGGSFVGRSSADQLGSLRPTTELSSFRTPVERLYLCGQSSHPGLGILGAAGYVAANVIADDLALDKWWLR